MFILKLAFYFSLTALCLFMSQLYSVDKSKLSYELAFILSMIILNVFNCLISAEFYFKEGDND